MIVDTSALIAVLNNEPDAERFADALLIGTPSIGAPTLVEASLVVGAEGFDALDTLIRRTLTEVVEFGAEHARAARVAHAQYGRGSGSPARLNFGDCLSYAVAKVRDEPLLFKGADFTHTDVRAALSAGPAQTGND